MHDRREQARNVIGAGLGEEEMARQEADGGCGGITPLERCRISEQRLQPKRLGF
jgi:hypothetical protein